MAGRAELAGWTSLWRTVPLVPGGMLGAGVFVGVAPAAEIAGGWMVLAVPLAALTALCAAISTAHQSASYRGGGAGYSCVRDKLGDAPGRAAAGTHLAGHVTAMAATTGAAAEYLPFPKALTTVAVLVFVALLFATGVRIRGLAGWLWLGLTLAVLAVVVTACLTIAPVAAEADSQHRPLAVTSAAGVLFFAFLGFERLTSPGTGERRLPARAVRRGLLLGTSVTAAVLLTVVFAVTRQLGAVRLGLSGVPLLDALRAADAAALVPAVGLGAGLVMVPVLLGTLRSARSVGLAVVADGELPGLLGRRTGDRPCPLDGVLLAVAAVLALLLTPAVAMGVAACCLLVHYAFVNAAARVLLADEWTWSMRAACLGMGLSVILAMSMPVPVMAATAVVTAAMPVGAALLSRTRPAVRRRLPVE
ncbi:APC family permease [Actinopolyspora mortivallis]|uniref:APC family permease n=1 Tax=Actinopolyspora mortivallis TaxID=33906 RepID=UPI0003A07E25|nr:APC family permease [Actinopolyspora mortivallis]